jgi:hypothetical protein
MFGRTKATTFWRFFALGFFTPILLGTLVPTVVMAAPMAVQAAIDFTPWAMQGIDILAVVLTVGAGIVAKFAVSFLASKTKLSDTQFEALAADRVNDILVKSIDAGEAWMKAQVADPNSPIKRVEVNNFLLEQIVRIAQTSMPDLIKFFGLTEDRLRTMILSRLNGYMAVPAADSGKVALTTSPEASEPVTISVRG